MNGSRVDEIGIDFFEPQMKHTYVTHYVLCMQNDFCLKYDMIEQFHVKFG